MKIRDISHHDTDNGAPLDLTPYAGVLIKATEGVGYTDPKLDANVAAVRATGKPFGLYHYLSFASEVTEQISDFSAQVAKYPDATLHPALDVETDTRNNKAVPGDINARIAAFAAAIPGIMLYANPSMLAQLDDGVAGKLPLWQAEYNPQPRDVPGYTRIGWQYRGDPDESDFTDTILVQGTTAPQPVPVVSKPAAPVDDGSRPAPAFPLAPGQYFGPEGGGTNSISGYHSHSDDLRRWQQRMADRGWAISVDGLYGPRGATTPQGNTADETRKFQAEKGLAADALIGPETWAKAWTAPIT